MLPSHGADERRTPKFQENYTQIINVLLSLRVGEHRPAERRERRPQAAVLCGTDGVFDTRGRLRVDSWRRPALPTRRLRRRRTIHVGDPRHGAVTIVRSDSLENLGFEMLKLDRDRPRYADPERAVPPQPIGPGTGSDGLAHDRRPRAGDLGRGESRATRTTWRQFLPISVASGCAWRALRLVTA